MFHVDLSPFGVDVERLKSDRLSRLQGIMRARDLSALLLTDPLNIRYATNTVLWLNLRATGVQRFALVPADGEPVVYERLMGSERAAGLKKAGPVRGFGAYMFGMRPPVATEHFVDLVADGLADMGLNGERVGIDALCLTAVDLLRNKGFGMVDGLPALGESRVVKTQDEVELIRWTSRAKEGGYDLVREAIRKPPVLEERLSRMMLEYLLEQGFEAGSEFISIFDSSQMAIRPHREPMGMDLVMTEGDCSSATPPCPVPAATTATSPARSATAPPPRRTRTAMPRPTPRCRRPSAISSPVRAPPCSSASARRRPRVSRAWTASTAWACASTRRPGSGATTRRSTSFPWKRT